MLSIFANYENLWGPFRLLGHTTFRCIMAAITAFVLGFLLAPWVLGTLRKLKVNQGMRQKSVVGRLADLHASKKDTPTMGGGLIYLCVFLSILLWAKFNAYVVVAVVVYTGLTCLGFADDYLKVSRKNSKGVSAKTKLVFQGVLTVIVIMFLFMHSDTQVLVKQLWVPFLKYPLVREMPLLLVFVFFFFVMAGTSNAINITDGVDGLAIGCVIPVLMVYAIFAYAKGNLVFANYLNIYYIKNIEELAIICSAVLGAALVFLWYNAHPAEIFMGDTGSLSLGGLIGAIAFMTLEPFTLVIVGGVFVAETLSVMLQVASFKLTGKRIFKMAPIHHHFELKNWHETKVVVRFWILSFLFALAGLATLKLR